MKRTTCPALLAAPIMRRASRRMLLRNFSANRHEHRDQYTDGQDRSATARHSLAGSFGLSCLFGRKNEIDQINQTTSCRCSKRPSARPQRVKARGVPLRYVEGLNDARTPL